MTEDEKKAQREARNAAICAFYLAGNKAHRCASNFKLSTQSIVKVLKAGGVWKPYPRGKRGEFLGVTVKPETKAGLAQLAQDKDVSVSQFVSDTLDEVVK